MKLNLILYNSGSMIRSILFERDSICKRYEFIGGLKLGYNKKKAKNYKDSPDNFFTNLYFYITYNVSYKLILSL